MRHKIVYTLFFLSLAFLLVDCKKESSAAMAETDQALLAKAETATGFTYYKSDSTVHRSSPQSAHTGYFRVRFNDIASAALTDGGKLPTGGAFPTGSLVVKELHNDSTGHSIIGYAVMEKLPTDTNAAAGWVWAEYVLPSSGFKIAGKGSICTGCHSSNDRDKVRVFNLFP